MPRPRYTEEQLQQFYARINLPQQHRCSLSDAAISLRHPVEQLRYLTALQQHTLASIPFENLSLHYSRTPAIDLHPTSLFEKIVSNPAAGRGGYCMELNTLFATVLRTIGIPVTSTGGRVSSQASPNGCASSEEDGFYFGFAHMVNIVTLSGSRYLVDVGFGAGGPVCPIPLEEGTVQQEPGFAKRRLRVRWDAVSDDEDQEAKVWHLEQRRAGSEVWTGLYCFLDHVEFSPADFEVLNCFASCSRKSFYVNEIVVVKFLHSGTQDGIEGEMVLVGNRLHRRIKGVKEEPVVLVNEQERVEALEKYFGIRLDHREQMGIMGMGTMLEG